MNGEPARPDEAARNWAEAPAGYARTALGAWDESQLVDQCEVLHGYPVESKLVGYCEVLHGYPDERTDYVGLLLVDEKLRGRGIGRRLFQEAQARSRAHRFRLAVLENNPAALEFWRHLGFCETGERKPFGRSTAILFEKSHLAA